PARPLAARGRRGATRAGPLAGRRARRAGDPAARRGGLAHPGRAARGVAGGPGRRAADRARAGEPVRERAQVLTGARARPSAAGGDGDPRARARRRALARDRAWLRRGERRSRLGRVATGPWSDVRGRAPSSGRAVSGARILVVDDERQILRALQTSLRGAGYEVETAETAETALAAAAMRPPDALIVDLVLPDGTGTDVVRELRTWSSAPVIVLSAVGDEREKVAALDAGADDYVTKPVGIDELIARLRAALRRATPSAEPVLTVGELELDLEKRELR